MHLIIIKTQNKCKKNNGSKIEFIYFIKIIISNIFLCWKKIGNQFCFDSTEQLKIALLTLIHATTVVLSFMLKSMHAISCKSKYFCLPMPLQNITFTCSLVIMVNLFHNCLKYLKCLNNLKKCITWLKLKSKTISNYVPGSTFYQSNIVLTPNLNHYIPKIRWTGRCWTQSITLTLHSKSDPESSSISYLAESHQSINVETIKLQT